MLSMGLGPARVRAAMYLEQFGARATVSRKQSGAWGVVHDNIPMMVEALSGGDAVRIDAMEGSSDGSQGYRLSVAPDIALRSGDRVETTATSDTLTIDRVMDTSLDVYRQATALVERTAAETYTITIERWDGSAYVTVLEVEAQAAAATSGEPTETGGAIGTAGHGIVTITPPPVVAIGEGDWVHGIPWAPGAQVTRVRPIVGSRLELDITVTTGAR